MKISLIAGIANNNVIGYNNKMPWLLPADLKYFKEVTTGHYIIMGRKNFESIGRALPNRTSVIITRNANYRAPEGCLIVNSLNDALRLAKNEDEVFIIGGGEIYKMAMPMADKLYITKIDLDCEGDVFFPDISTEHWKLVDQKDFEPNGKNNNFYSFQIYERKLSK